MWCIGTWMLLKEKKVNPRVLDSTNEWADAILLRLGRPDIGNYMQSFIY